MMVRPGIACGDPGLSVLDLDHQVFAVLLPQVIEEPGHHLVLDHLKHDRIAFAPCVLRPGEPSRR